MPGVSFRQFVDNIFSFIGSSTMTDLEFATITLTAKAYTVPLYTAVLAILDARETVSGARDRLGFYFMAKNVAIGVEPPAGNSNILIGSDL